MHFGYRPILENRTGADGFLAAEAVARGTAAGPQLLICPLGPKTISPGLPGMHLSIDVARDLVPIANVARSSYAVVTGANTAQRSLEELLAAAAARPFILTSASAGYGQAQHLWGDRLKRMAAVALVHVPYRGAAPAVLDVIAGRADLPITKVGDVIRQLQEGQLRLLARGDRAGWPEFADAPRLPDIVPAPEVVGRFGICGPRGMPEQKFARWAAAVRAMLDDPAVRQRLIDSGLAPAFEDPATFARTISRGRAAWAEIKGAAFCPFLKSGVGMCACLGIRQGF